MWTATASKTVVDGETGDEIIYLFSATGTTEDIATNLVLLYVSMVEYGTLAAKYAPGEMFFPREQLYSFIQREQLQIIEGMYPDAVATAYSNAMAYVQSYIGAMFDVDAMLESGDTTSTALTLRLALCTATAVYLLGVAPQYSETMECHQKQLALLLKGLKSGGRNFGKGGIVAEPNVRATIVELTNRPGTRP